MDAIVVRGIAAEGVHGMEDERSTPQPYEVDVELALDLKAAANADQLAETIDYAGVADTVRAVVRDNSFELLETLADAIAGELLVLGADAVRVRVFKPRAAEHIGARDVSVIVER